MNPVARLLKSWPHHLSLALIVPAALTWAIASPIPSQIAQSQPNASNSDGGPMRVLSDEQVYDARSGVVTARGNVKMSYPTRQIQATAAQAQYFSRERRIILSGNVFILQQGNTIRGETVVYEIDQGVFTAIPQRNRQVESIYIVPASSTQPVAGPVPATPNFRTPPGSSRRP